MPFNLVIILNYEKGVFFSFCDSSRHQIKIRKTIKKIIKYLNLASTFSFGKEGRWGGEGAQNKL